MDRPSARPCGGGPKTPAPPNFNVDGLFETSLENKVGVDRTLPGSTHEPVNVEVRRRRGISPTQILYAAWVFIAQATVANSDHNGYSSNFDTAFSFFGGRPFYKEFKFLCNTRCSTEHTDTKPTLLETPPPKQPPSTKSPAKLIPNYDATFGPN